MKAPVTSGTIDMNLTNDSYVILISTKNFTERYYHDKNGWLKVSARGRDGGKGRRVWGGGRRYP